MATLIVSFDGARQTLGAHGGESLLIAHDQTFKNAAGDNGVGLCGSAHTFLQPFPEFLDLLFELSFHNPVVHKAVVWFRNEAEDKVSKIDQSTGFASRKTPMFYKL